MTITELLNALKQVRKQYRRDPEVAHEIADSLLLEFIDDRRVSRLHGKLAEWYA